MKNSAKGYTARHRLFDITQELTRDPRECLWSIALERLLSNDCPLEDAIELVEDAMEVGAGLLAKLKQAEKEDKGSEDHE